MALCLVPCKLGEVTNHQLQSARKCGATVHVRENAPTVARGAQSTA
jgi:hypothetical protein